jgi:hypothetical protein
MLRKREEIACCLSAENHHVNSFQRLKNCNIKMKMLEATLCLLRDYLLSLSELMNHCRSEFLDQLKPVT